MAPINARTPRTACLLLCASLILPALLAAPALSAPASGWSIAEHIDADHDGFAYNPSVAVAPDGTAMAVWYEEGVGHTDIWANHFVPGHGWGVATMIDFNAASNAFSPRVGVDAEGNAVAVWIQEESHLNAYAARYAAGVGWSGPVALETNDTDAVGIEVAVGADGSAAAVWLQRGSFDDVWANHFTPEGGWEGAVMVEAQDGIVFTLRVAASGGGTALAIWQQYHDPAIESRVYSSEYVGGAGWGRPTMVEDQDAGGAEMDADVALDPNGNGVVVWAHYNNFGNQNVSAGAFIHGRGWERVGLLEHDDTGVASKPKVDVDAAGDAVAIWLQSDGIRYSIWASSMPSGGTWSGAAPVERTDYDASGASLAADAAGDAVAVWGQDVGGRSDVWASRTTLGGKWQAPELIETDNAWYAGEADVGIDAGGNAVAVWKQSDQLTWNVWGNNFVAPDITAPSLSVTAPAQGAVINGTAVWVAGTAEPGSSVSVDGVGAALAPDGSFGLLVAVAPGPHTIEIRAWDSWENSANRTVAVTVVDRVPALEAQLSSTEANLTAARLDLSAAQAALSAIEESGDATDADLAGARDNVTAAQAQVAALQSAQATDAAALAAARSRIDALEQTLTATRG